MNAVRIQFDVADSRFSFLDLMAISVGRTLVIPL